MKKHRPIVNLSGMSEESQRNIIEAFAEEEARQKKLNRKHAK